MSGYDAGKKVLGRKRHVLDRHPRPAVGRERPSRAAYRTGTAPRRCFARLDEASRSLSASSETRATKGRRCKPPSPAPARGNSRSSAAATGKGSSCCRKDGSSSAPWHGSAVVVGGHEITSVTLERRPRSSASP